MNEIGTILVLLGGMVILLGLPSRWLEAHPVPPSLLALLYGVLVGPVGLGVVDLDAMGNRPEILLEITRITLGIALFGVALRIPREFPRRWWRQMAALVGAGMLLMWVTSTLLIHLLLPLPFLVAAMIGAMVTPTDPVAASPIVTGPTAEENLPRRVRDTISFESGANDGLSYLFVFLPLLLLTRARGEALPHWLLHTLLWEVVAATILGLALGYGGARLLSAAEERGVIEEDWRLVFTVALALLALGIGRLLQSDELLLVFAAGFAFVQVISADDRRNEEGGHEAVNRFFSYPAFAVLGVALPWSAWGELGWAGVLCAIAILLFRRLPALLLLRPLLPGLRSRRDILYIGWFGPIAVAAMYYAALVETEHGLALPWAVVTLVICASVLVHGVSAVPLTRLYGRAARRAGEEVGPDEEDESEHRAEAEQGERASGEG
jgi:sodium/hydrogen antiporter